MAAADIVKIQVLENGTTRELTVYSPGSNILWVNHESDQTYLTMGINGLSDLLINFQSMTALETFLTDLETAMTDSTGTVTLTNEGTVEMITTTSTTSTTTTTTTAAP